MRRIVGILLISAVQSSAQDFEFALQAQSGFFNFYGKNAAHISFMSESDVSSFPNLTDIYYGKKPAVSYSLGADLKFLTKTEWFLGAGAAFESLQSSVKIDTIYSFAGVSAAYGQTKLMNQFINLNPYIGKRFEMEETPLDVSVGIDIGFGLSSHEKGKAKRGDGSEVRTDLDHEMPNVDLRPRIQVVGHFDKIGVLLGYSRGLTNYYPDQGGAQPEAYSAFLRVGISIVLD